MNKKAIIFDMDGVLFDSEPVYLAMFRKFLEDNQCKVDEKILYAIAGASSAQTWDYMIQMWKEEIGPQELRKIFHEQCPNSDIPYQKTMFPGIPKLLAWLKEQGFVLALASSSSMHRIQQMFDETGLGGYFSCVVSGNMFRESKPNPEIYLYTLSQLGYAPEECLVVEDSPYGIQAGKAAGMQVVGIRDTRFSYDQTAADWLIDETRELREFLETH